MPLNFDNHLEVKDCIFIKGLRTNSSIKISDVREYFEERVGECDVQMTSLSKDRERFFVALKFKTPAIAGDVLERYNGKYMFGNRVTLSYWRIPRNDTHLAQLHQALVRANSRSSEWASDDCFANETEVADRDNTGYPRDKNAQNRKTKPRETLPFEDKGGLFEYQEQNFFKRYDGCEKGSYEEETGEYLQEHWEGDEAEEGYYEQNWNDWKSDYSGGSQNLSEREYYEREEESWYQWNDDAWKRSQFDDNTSAYIDEIERRNYDIRYPETDINSEFCTEPYQDRFQEECGRRCYDDCSDLHSQEADCRTENVCVRKREWYNEREYKKRPESQNRSQGDDPGKFSSFDQTVEWPKWECLPHCSPPRRRLSDPVVPHDNWNQLSEGHELAEQRAGYNKGRDLTSRKTSDRPRSDEWLRFHHREERQGCYSAPRENSWLKMSDHQGSPLLGGRESLSPEPRDSVSCLDRKRGDNVGDQRSNSPAMDRHPYQYRSQRGSSSELSSDYSRYDSSPREDRLSHSWNEQTSATRQKARHSFSPSGRHSSTEEHEKGIRRTSSRRECGLHRSLMFHQQKRHLSSHPKGSVREKGTRHSSPERRKKNCPGDLNRSNSSHSSTEFCSPPEVGNRKRQHDDEKTKGDLETAEKRRQTNHRSVNQSDTESRKSKGGRKVDIKTRNGSKRLSHEKRKRCTLELKDKVSEKSNTRRTDRLLSDLAASLAEDNISLKRPDLNADAPQEGALNGVSFVERESSSSAGFENNTNQLLRSDEGLPFVLDTEDCSQAEEAPEGKSSAVIENITTELAVSFGEGNFVKDKDVPIEFQDSEDLPDDNLHRVENFLDEKQRAAPSAEDRLVTDNGYSQDHDFATIDKSGTFMGDHFEQLDAPDFNRTEVPITFVRQLEEANTKADDVCVVDMEFSSDATPDVVRTGEVFWSPRDLSSAVNSVGKRKKINNSKNGRQNLESAEFCADDSQLEIHGENVSNVVHCEEKREGYQSPGHTNSKSGNGTKRNHNTEQDAQRVERISGNNVYKESHDRCFRSDIDFDKANANLKYVEEARDWNKAEENCVSQKGLTSTCTPRRIDDGCVTHREVYCCQPLSTPDIDTANWRHCTDNIEFIMSSTEDHVVHVDSHTTKTISAGDVTNKPHTRMSNAEYPTLYESSLENINNSKTVRITGISYVIRSDSSTSSAVETQSPQVSLANTDKFPISSLNPCTSDRLLPATNLEHVDMDISDEEYHENVSNSTVCVTEEERDGYHDASTLYSLSSPTRKKDGDYSPAPPKDESSPCSPSHPTNVTGGDMEHNDPIKELCYGEDETGRDGTSETRKDMVSEVSKIDGNTNMTGSDQMTNNGGDVSGKDYGSSRAKSPHPHHASAKDRAQNGAKANGECLEGDARKIAPDVDDLSKNVCTYDTRKALVRCSKKTQSLLTSAPDDSQNKPSTFFNSSNSHCLGEATGKRCASGEASRCDSIHDEMLTVSGNESEKDEKIAGHISRLLGGRFHNDGATLELGKEATDVQEGDCTGNSATDMTTVSTAEEGSVISTDAGAVVTQHSSSFDRQEGSNMGEEHESGDRVAGRNLNNKALVSACVTSNSRKTNNKDCSAGSEAMKRGDENNNFTGFPLSSVSSSEVTEIASSDVEKTVDKAMNSIKKRKNYNGVSPSPIASLIKEDTSTFKALQQVKESQRYVADIGSQSNAQITELPLKCNPSADNIVKALNGDVSCGPDKIKITCDMAGKKPLSSGLPTTANENNGSQSSLSEDDRRTKSAVRNDRYANKNSQLDEDSNNSEVLSPFTGKRPRVNSSIGPSHLRKAPRKQLKLIIPTRKIGGRGGKRMVVPGGTSARKTGCCTFTPENLDFLPGSNGLPGNKKCEVRTSTVKGTFVDAGSVHGKETTTLSSSSETMTRADNCGAQEISKRVSTFAGIGTTDAGKMFGEERLKYNKADGLDNELSTFVSSQNNSTNQVENTVLCQGEVLSPTTSNMSPSSTRALMSLENSSMEKQKGNGVSTEGKADHTGNEIDWRACRMERLRKKKEQIEQVYRRECQTVVNVVKMLVSKDPRLESVLQNAVRCSLQEMGQRCVQELEKEYRPAT